MQADQAAEVVEEEQGADRVGPMDPMASVTVRAVAVRTGSRSHPPTLAQGLVYPPSDVRTVDLAEEEVGAGVQAVVEGVARIRGRAPKPRSCLLQARCCHPHQPPRQVVCTAMALATVDMAGTEARVAMRMHILDHTMTRLGLAPSRVPRPPASTSTVLPLVQARRAVGAAPEARQVAGRRRRAEAVPTRLEVPVLETRLVRVNGACERKKANQDASGNSATDVIFSFSLSPVSLLPHCPLDEISENQKRSLPFSFPIFPYLSPSCAFVRRMGLGVNS